MLASMPLLRKPGYFVNSLTSQTYPLYNQAYLRPLQDSHTYFNLGISAFSDYIDTSLPPPIQPPILLQFPYQFISQCIYMNEEAKRRKKTKNKGQMNAFTCQLVYFLVKALFLLALYKNPNYLTSRPIAIAAFVTLLVVNTYLMLTTGSNPGHEPLISHIVEQNQKLTEEQGEKSRKDDGSFCDICKIYRKNRTKHCFYCGKCTRKFDHHCPWIGSCVGQNNHFKFWTLLLTHTLQACMSFYICCESIQMLSPASDQSKNGHIQIQNITNQSKIQANSVYNQQYAVFAVFGGVMVLYICFAGSLLLFQTYLIATNSTSKQLFDRKKCWYLKDINYNPFSKGILTNIAQAIFWQPQGNQWIIDKSEKKREKTCCQLLWENEYYSCC